MSPAATAFLGEVYPKPCVKHVLTQSQTELFDQSCTTEDCEASSVTLPVMSMTTMESTLGAIPEQLLSLRTPPTLVQHWGVTAAHTPFRS